MQKVKGDMIYWINEHFLANAHQRTTYQYRLDFAIFLLHIILQTISTIDNAKM